MSMVTLKMFGNLRTILAASEHRIDVEGKDMTIGHFLGSLIGQYGQQLRQELFDTEGEIKLRYAVLINGRNIASLSGLATKLKDEDVVAILPVVEGG